jgi:hypothetical protein
VIQKFSFLLLLAAAMVGCAGSDDAPSLVAATGTVFYEDKPVAGATVTFQVENAPISTGLTNAEGKFTMTTGGRPGVPLGPAKVGIAKVTATQQDMTAMKPEDMQKMQMQNKGVTPMAKPEIPEKYGNPEKSGLVATLDADGGKNVFEFRLVD